MKKLLHHIKNLYFVLLLLAFSGNILFGQTVGDYRSITTGNWTSLSSWQYYNGTSWVTPSGTSPQGYPGQYAGTGAVAIQGGHTIAINGDGTATSFQTLPMGTVTITGKLYLNGINSSSSIMEFDTQLIYVTPNIGIIEFNGKVSLWVVSSDYPGTSVLTVNRSGSYASIIGDCSHNQDIYFGPGYTSYCAASPTTTFDALMDGGGSLNAIIAPVASVCEGGTINLEGSITGPAGTGLTYSWYLNGSATAFATGPIASINNAVAGSKIIKLICSTTYGSTSYSNSETITVVVNTLPDNTVSSGFSGGSFCTGSQATLTFDAVDTNGAPPYTLSYTDGMTTFSQIIPTNAATAFNVSATTSTGYTLNSITNANGCVNLSPTNKTASVTFRPTPTATIGGTTAVCVGATSPNITFTNPQSAGITITYTINGGTNQTVSVVANGSTNVSVPTTTSGSFVYELVSVVYSTNPTCVQSLTGSATVAVNTLPSTPAVSITQPTCTLSTGTITVTIQNVGETYSFDNGVTFQAGNSKSGLAAGNYSVIIKSTGGCNSPTTSVTIKSDTNIWDGSVWSNSTAPISTENIVFNGFYSTSTDLVGCSCQVNNSVAVIVNSGHTLTLTNGLTVAASGSITFQNNASLVQINNVPNSGNIKYVRTTNTVVLSNDYTYWSSPVSPQTIGSFSPKTREGMMFSYDSSIDDWKQEYLATSMVAGVGYIVRGPEPSALPPPPSPYTVNFVGVPHNGDYSVPAIADRSYLLGNPYPSALDANTFLNANSNVLDGTLYFWTHITPIGTGVSNPGTGIYAYSGDDYATYNQTGGTSAAPTGGSVPNGKIGAGQGFFASTKTSISGTAIVYSNSMRVGVGGITGSNSQFFKTRNPKEKEASSIEKNRVWLNMTNAQGAFKQTLVGYITDATNDYDSRFDGESFDGNKFVDFYSINQDKNLAIQGRALPFDENDQVPLGFRTTIDGTFTVNIDQTDGLFANQQVFIEDKLTNTISDLKSGNYTFSTKPGTFNDRFVLRYKNNAKTLGIKNIDSLENTVLVSSKNKQIKINSFAETIDKVMVYDLLGRQFYQKENVNSNEFLTTDFVSSHQTLVVKTVLQNGAIVTNKIIF